MERNFERTNSSTAPSLVTKRLMIRHHRRLAADLGRKLPENVRSYVSVDDVLQEAYMIVFSKIGTFQPRGPGAFHRWLSRIAENRLFDAIRSERADKRGGGRLRLEPVGRGPGGHRVGP